MVFEKDFGVLLLLYILFLVVVYFVIQWFSWVVIGLILFVVGILVVYFIFEYVWFCVQIWLDLFVDLDGIGYQIVQLFFSFVIGGIFGIGFGNG